MYRTKDGKRIAVRRATRRDIGGVVRLWQALADERKYVATETVTVEQKNRWAKSVDDHGVLGALAEIEGELVGSLSLVRHRDSEKSKHVRNLAMGVAREYRGMGVGTALMDYAIRWARQRKVKKIVLSVFSTNRQAIALYKKFGFTSEGRRKSQFLIDDKYVDEIMMARFM
jgi:ribosomal protein S18 acetylase RimI-like enzyme